MADTFASFAIKLGKLAKDLSGPQMKTLMTDLGVNAKKTAAAAVSVDLGGTGFSGWAAPLDTTFDHIGNGAISFHPTKTGAGPWTVAQRGRNQGNASGFSGPGINHRTGITSRTKSGALRKVRATKGRRWNGTTMGKHTATKALDKIDSQTTTIVEKYLDDVMNNLN